ncbi:MAG: phosphonate ABC transporter ATP-binding protein [Anaerolineae bacterium]|jgi:phosphonate transport system ATP-binding protein|nr:phosphonate ABC transporter ATP-binding protein [Anaerolineae bacterium]
MLEVKDLRVVFPNGVEALKSISLSAGRGEIIAIVGRSGAGKSTLLRCINGLQSPTAGHIVLDGDDITGMNATQLRLARRYIGFIWQEYNLVERLPAITNVLTGRLGYNTGWRSLLGYFDAGHRQIALQNLERVGLLHRARNRADKLSGGEKQRVAIARAISQEPKIILADEPVASLDPELSVQVMSDLSRVAREIGVLTLINIHQVDLARRFADRIIGIARGKVEYDGRPEGLTDAVLDRIYRFDHQIKPVHTIEDDEAEVATA